MYHTSVMQLPRIFASQFVVKDPLIYKTHSGKSNYLKRYYFWGEPKKEKGSPGNHMFLCVTKRQTGLANGMENGTENELVEDNYDMSFEIKYVLLTSLLQNV